MNNIKVVFALIIVLSFTGIAVSQVNSGFSKMEMTEKFISQRSSENSEIEKKYNGSVQSDPREKSPYLGALFSGIIPGTGEFYAKSYIKGAIFLAVEAGLWIAYANYESKGDDQTEQYEQYANQNWDVYKYAGWLKDQSFSGSDGIDLSSNREQLRRQVNVCEAQNFSHQLPPYGEQQYYELIGKYQNFVPGWHDADLSYVNRNNYGTYKTQMFTDYSYNRQEANDYYDNATTSLTLIVLNHLLSAADGAWSVSMFNKDLKVKTGVHLEKEYSELGQKKLVPVANLNVSF